MCVYEFGISAECPSNCDQCSYDATLGVTCDAGQCETGYGKNGDGECGGRWMEDEKEFFEHI